MQNGMTQNDLASSLGLTRQNFYNKMVANSFTPEQVEKIASIFKVPVSFFTNDTEADRRMEIDSSTESTRLREKIEDLERIISEKERSISVMESLIEYLKHQKPE